MSLRTCTVSYCDLKGVEHAIEVTADSLYEAVAQGLRCFAKTIWIDEVGHGQTTISVVEFAFRTSNGGSNHKGERLPR